MASWRGGVPVEGDGRALEGDGEECGYHLEYVDNAEADDEASDSIFLAEESEEEDEDR